MHLNHCLPVLLLATAVTAQVKWTTIKPQTQQSKLSNHSLVWTGDAALLFGGEDNGYKNDTWEWRSGTWKLLSPTTKPPVRAGAAMGYDPVRKVVVLFSGWNGGSYLADTWEWNGSNWAKMAPTTQPPPRDWATMAYDPIFKRMVLFGGHDYRRHANNGPGAYGDTWTWDGKSWTQLSPQTACQKRFGHVMVLDERRKVIVVHGGSTPGTQYNDMWQFVAGNWVQVKPTTLPGSRLFASMAYDSHRDRVVMTSGRNGSTVMADTWEYDGNNWNQRLTTGGPNVTFAQAVFDTVRQEMLNIGGALSNNRKTPTDQNMTYASSKSARITEFGKGCAGANGTPALTSTAPWLQNSYTVTATNMPKNGTVNLFAGLSTTSWGAIKLPWDLKAINAAGCTLYVDGTYWLTMTNNGGTATLQSIVPGFSFLVGVNVHMQAWAGDSTANPLGLVVSNAVTGTIGQK